MANMTKTLDRIQTLVAHNEVRVSLHGSEELAADDVQVRDVIARSCDGRHDRGLSGVPQRRDAGGARGGT